jgi:hypothetical protein
MSVQNFVSLRCAKRPQDVHAIKPEICAELDQWSKAQRKSIGDLLTFGSPGQNGGPIRSESRGR